MSIPNIEKKERFFRKIRTLCFYGFFLVLGCGAISDKLFSVPGEPFIWLAGALVLINLFFEACHRKVFIALYTAKSMTKDEAKIEFGRVYPSDPYNGSE